MREAAQADIPAFVDFKTKAWEQTYVEFVDPRVFTSLKEKRSQQIDFWRAELERGQKLFVAEDADGSIVGAAAGTKPKKDGRRELLLLYVDKEVQGQGIGARLMADSIGDDPATLWVMGVNTPAIGFYKRHGFVPTGEERRSELPSRYGAEITDVQLARDAHGAEA
ncbi:GNAT family N-acetyltransferase [Micrococcoides hystricis]|uniref:GNAT family N-acetyltransferase n=1 Tax=Micrococcoides hystricis TaxID=1572761 RepID=A0ABV6PAH3_9MICC